MHVVGLMVIRACTRFGYKPDQITNVPPEVGFYNTLFVNLSFFARRHTPKSPARHVPAEPPERQGLRLAY